MYKIGEFSKLTNLSIRTLRYYDDIGLLVPEDIDIYTSYRYYGENNIREARLIEELKSVDFSLEEIKTLLNRTTKEMLEEKKKDLAKEIVSYEQKIKKIDDLKQCIVHEKIILKDKKEKEN